MKGAFCNIVGPQIRRLRDNQGWSQDECAVQLQLAGLDISRESLAKVESQIHDVEDHHLPYYAWTLGVGIDELFHPLRLDKPIHEVIARLRSRSRPKVAHSHHWP